MAKAKKLPSGSWRVRVFSHMDAAGKAHYESFTASSKAEAELLAAQFAGNKKRRRCGDLTVAEAVEGYISAKTGVLSPKTIREYRQIQKTRFDAIGGIRVKKLTNEILQVWISSFTGQLSAKTVGNVWGLLRPALAMYLPDTYFRVTLPKKPKRRPVAPPDEDVALLFSSASKNLQRAIALAAFSSMRRSEICAITYGDIEDGWAHIRRDMVQNEHNTWIIKELPKTEESDRMTPLPDAVVKLLGTGDPDQRIVPVRPDTITRMFSDLRRKLFGEDKRIKFHTLRHYYASIAAVLGVPDIYTADFGGWDPDSKVLRQVYKNKIMPMANIYARQMGAHFDGVMGMMSEKTG